MAEVNGNLKEDVGRLFIDMDGTLAVFKQVDTLETLYEEGYFRNLAPHQRVVNAVKEIKRLNPDMEIYIMSSVLSDSRYALSEKNEWLDQYLPEIDEAHRIFPPCGVNKLDYVPDGIRQTDHLLDDYTQNLVLWEPPAKGIKILNGINHTRESWIGNMISFEKTSAEIARNILDVMEGKEIIRDDLPSYQEITMANQEYDKKVKIDYISKEERNGVQFITKPQALEALRAGIHICMVASGADYHGSHKDEYSISEIHDMKGVHDLYGTFGNGVEHRACISPHYNDQKRMKELLMKRMEASFGITPKDPAPKGPKV